MIAVMYDNQSMYKLLNIMLSLVAFYTEKCAFLYFSNGGVCTMRMCPTFALVILVLAAKMAESRYFPQLSE